MIVEICIVILLSLMVYGVNWARNNEKKQWNNGKCPSCDNTHADAKWEHFDTDSQGGRGYKCPTCNNHIWMSYAWDKAYYRKRERQNENRR